MFVSLVELAADAYLTCLTHALTTEKEEVMGLLLGEVRSVFGCDKPRRQCSVLVDKGWRQGGVHKLRLPHEEVG